MAFWYLIDEPRDRPAWTVNPPLWEGFRRFFNDLHGHDPEKNEIYTEAYIVQMLDATEAGDMVRHEA